jgi:hypothetical protein
MKNTYYYDVDSRTGLNISLVSLEYDDEVNGHNLKIASGDKVAYIGLYPEELAEIYNGVIGDYLKHRIRSSMSEISAQ